MSQFKFFEDRLKEQRAREMARIREIRLQMLDLHTLADHLASLYFPDEYEGLAQRAANSSLCDSPEIHDEERGR